MDEKEIGKLLKSIREARGLSQRKLAKRSGVANATISQIESGAFNPTVGMLKKILTGIPMSLSEFFSGPVGVQEPKVFFRASQLTELSDGGVSYRQIGRDLRDRTIQLMSERYEPGATTGRHALRHDGEECGIVLKGSITVTVGERSQVLGPGDAYYFSSDQPHSFKNEGHESCEIISACSPPTF